MIRITAKRGVRGYKLHCLYIHVHILLLGIPPPTFRVRYPCHVVENYRVRFINVHARFNNK